MRRLRWAMWAVAMCVAPAAGAGTLDDVRKTTRTAKPDPPRPESKRDRRASRSSHEDGDEEEDPLQDLLVALLLLPWWGPSVLLEDEFRWADGFHPSPYGGPSGQGWTTRPTAAGERVGGAWAARLSAEGAYVFDDTWRGRARARVDLPLRMTLRATVDRLSEDGDALDLVTGDVLFRFAQSPEINFYSGLGVRTFGDGAGREWGGQLVYGVDVLVGAPLMLGLEAGVGVLGEATAWNLRATLGALVVPGVEIYGGWDHLGLEGVTSVGLGGPLAGLKGWL
jgi:hypothetical protein